MYKKRRAVGKLTISHTGIWKISFGSPCCQAQHACMSSMSGPTCMDLDWIQMAGKIGLDLCMSSTMWISCAFETYAGKAQNSQDTTWSDQNLSCYFSGSLDTVEFISVLQRAFNWEALPTDHDLYYRNDPMYWDRYAFANSVDLDQMPQHAASDQGSHCLSYIEQYLRHTK